ncbi:MAG: hypothetical protein QXZ44_02775 [Ferroplasma sp.]
MAYIKRENSYWVFSRELKDSVKLDGDEKRPYIITPLGTRLKRILITGTITFKNSDERLIKMTVADYIGSFYITAFKTGFSSEIAEEVDKFNVNDTVMIMGKVNSFKTEDGIFYFSLNPELIRKISDIERYFWGERTTYVAKRKLMCITEAKKDEMSTAETLQKLGYTAEEAASAIRARELYPDYDFTSYMNSISSINYDAAPEPVFNNLDAVENHGTPENSPTVNLDGFVLNYIKKTDTGPGCRYDDLVKACTEAGFSRDKVDEALNALGSNGDVYEVSLKRYKAL